MLTHKPSHLDVTTCNKENIFVTDIQVTLVSRFFGGIKSSTSVRPVFYCKLKKTFFHKIFLLFPFLRFLFRNQLIENRTFNTKIRHTGPIQ